jgi:hypothetical protein
MRKTLKVVLPVVYVLVSPLRGDEPRQNWTHYVRIGAYGLSSTNASAIIRDAQAGHVFGIEVDNDITGRYESFLDPTEKLAAIRAFAEQAHQIRNKAFVYIAGTECITANAEKAQHSVLKDHPDWLQRNLAGEAAVFTSGAAFWIRPGDEDVWISPYAVEWRKVYLQRVRQIASTGIDGIYVDIPYWMTHFRGWNNSWASFDDSTVTAFKQKTGLDARKDLKLGDFSDPNFRKWITFRIETLTDFVREIGDTARSVNPSIMVIPEIYPGIEEEAVRVGADVYEMYPVADAIAHEYEFGPGDHLASSRPQLDWFLYQAGMLSFRAFAEGKATWLLNYSWDGDKGIDPREAMKTLAASQLVAGVNFWDAPGLSMAGSNDSATRAQIFDWIARHEKTFYLPRDPMDPVGVYFSPSSRNFDAGRFLPSYRGALLLFLQKHLEFQVVTPRTIASFRGQTLVLPDVSILDDIERGHLRNFLDRGGRLVITGSDASGLGSASNIRRFSYSPGSVHLAALEKDFAGASRELPETFFAALNIPSDLSVSASPLVASNIASVGGKPHIFLANFSGIIPHRNLRPGLESSAAISVLASRKCTLTFLPLFGEEQSLPGKISGDRRIFDLPPFERGAVAWINDSN